MAARSTPAGHRPATQMPAALQIAVIPLEARFAARAAALAEQFGLAPASAGQATDPAAADALLEVGERLALRTLRPSRGGAVSVDFTAGRAAHRRQFGGGRSQPLARALGLKGGLSPRVVDATAGLGRDAFVLASLGCAVQLIERQPLLAELLADGLQRAAADAATAPIAARMALIGADAAGWLRGLDAAAAPDCVYLDPMYPQRDKSAAVKKEMRLLQRLAGPDQDSAELLAAALDCGAARVVVKRPKGAPPLAGPAPSAAIASANTRYDLYALRALAAPGQRSA